jgi:hypothetical protein
MGDFDRQAQDALLAGIDGMDDKLRGFVDLATFIKTPYVEPKFYVQHLAPVASLTILTGDTGSGKTAFLANLVVAVALGLDVAGRFTVTPSIGPILFFNGEMSNSTILAYMQEAAAGLGVDVIPKGRVLLDGFNAESTFRLSDPDERNRIEEKIREVEPSIVIFDTQRALFGIEENDAQAVRMAYSWVQGLCRRYDICAIVSHHIRKLGPVSNSDSQRVSGSRDIIAVADVHLALKSRDSKPLYALLVGKTRKPYKGVSTGTEWPIDARLEPPSRPGLAPKSIIFAGEPAKSEAAIEDAETEIVARLESEGSLTIADLRAGGGSAKRAFTALRNAGTVTAVGKRDRRTLYALVGAREADGNERGQANRTGGRVREKPSNDARLNGVSPDRVRDRTSRTEVECASAAGSADHTSTPSNSASEVKGQDYIGTSFVTAFAEGTTIDSALDVTPVVMERV